MVASAVVAQEPSPTAQSTLRPWPTGDALRTELQDIGFTFRIAGDSGDWLGWAPRAAEAETPALGLDSAGTGEATATFEFDLLDGDPGPALTGYMEVASRLPLRPGDVDQARRFILEDLLVDPPAILEPCYVSDWKRGALFVSVDLEANAARLQLAPSDAALEMPEDVEVEDCAALLPSEVADELAKLGEPSTERLSIGMSGDPAAFEPTDVALQGALVTLVLTFRNDTAAEQTLTFEQPLRSSTGPVAPGDLKLIVVRQLEPGEYPFYSESSAEGLRGVVRIEPAVPDPDTD
jgi:hypothetical protein